MGCRSSKSAAATEPLVSAPKTLLTTTDAYSIGDCRNLPAYAADVAKASDSEADALNMVECPMSGGRTEREVEAALQGLALADRTRLVDAFSCFLRVDIELSASDAGNIASVNASAGIMLDRKVQEPNGAMEATSASSMPTATAKSPQASSWISCCHAQTVGTTEFAA